MKLTNLKYIALAVVFLFAGEASAQLKIGYPTDVRFIAGGYKAKRPQYPLLLSALNDVKAYATSERPYTFWLDSDTVNIADWDSVYQTGGLAMNDSIDVHYVATGKIKWGGFGTGGTGGGGSTVIVPMTGTTTHYSLNTWSGQSGLGTWQTQDGVNMDSIDLKLWELIVYTDSVYLYVENDTLKIRASSITALVTASGTRPDTTIIAYKAVNETITGDWIINGDMTINTGSIRLSDGNNRTATSRVIWSATNKPFWSGSGAVGDSSEIVMVNTATGVLSIDSLITWFNLNEAVRDSINNIHWHDFPQATKDSIHYDFAQMVFKDSAFAIPCADGVWSPITNNEDSLWGKTVDYGDTTITFVGDSIQLDIGWYKVDLSLSFSGSNTDQWETEMFLDNVELNCTPTLRGMTGSTSGVIGVSGIFYVDTHGEFLSPRVFNTVNNNDLTAKAGSLVIQQLR